MAGDGWSIRGLGAATGKTVEPVHTMVCAVMGPMHRGVRKGVPPRVGELMVDAIRGNLLTRQTAREFDRDPVAMLAAAEALAELARWRIAEANSAEDERPAGERTAA